MLFLNTAKVLGMFSFSKTGHLNPRARKLTTLGFALGALEALRPNIDKCISSNGKSELFPAAIQVQTINRCNAKCVMCPYVYTVANEELQVMDDAVYSKIVDECCQEPNFGLFVPMAQTEPLLDTKMEKRISEFTSKRMPHQRIELVTNGSLLTPERMQHLIDAGLDLISISVNAPDKQTYQSIMRELDWEKLNHNLEGIAEMDLSRTNVFVRFIKQKDNYKAYRDFKRRWHSKGYNVLGYEVNNRSDSLQGYDNLMEPAEAKSFVKRFVRKHFAKRIFPVCPYAFSTMHVLANGDVPLCVNDFEHKEIMGNIQQSSVKEIYNSPRWIEIRNLMLKGHYGQIPTCKNCTLWKDANWL